MATRTDDEAFGLAAPPSVVNTSGHLVLTIVMSVMKRAAGTVPKELWGLARTLDLVAPRGFVVGGDVSFECYCQRLPEANLYPIVSLRTHFSFNKPIIIYQGIRTVIFGNAFNCQVNIPLGVEKLKFGQSFQHPILFPLGLQELEFDTFSLFNHPLVLPISLRRLTLGSSFDRTIILPEKLEYVKFCGNSSLEVTLPPAYFNHPLQLPPLLTELYLGDRFNYPIFLPPSVHTAKFGYNFAESVTFGTSLRKLKWVCNHALNLPITLKDLTLGVRFQQHVDLHEGLEKLKFEGEYSFPLVLPSTLTSITFYVDYVLRLVLPPGCVKHVGRSRWD